MEFSIDHIFTLAMLIVLQAVLGFDNLLYISLESKRAPEDKQKMVRTTGILIAIVLRIGLLFLLIALFDQLKAPLFSFHFEGYLTGEFNFNSLITLFGGVFIIYTAVKEIWHMIALEESDHLTEKKTQSTTKTIGLIVFMNVIFSFDSILSAMALTDVKWVMVVAIIISGALMIWLSDHVSKFLMKNRMYEVLGLFILFIVGIMLVSEGGHKAHLELFGYHVEAMTKTTFYFVIAILVIIDIVQGKYQKNLLKVKALKEKQLSDKQS